MDSGDERVLPMLETQILPAPSIPALPTGNAKREMEYRAFLQLLPTIIATHRGKYVAIHQGTLVGSGDNQTEVALLAYSKYGYVPIYVGLVSDEPQSVARVPSARTPNIGGA